MSGEGSLDIRMFREEEVCISRVAHDSDEQEAQVGRGAGKDTTVVSKDQDSFNRYSKATDKALKLSCAIWFLL